MVLKRFSWDQSRTDSSSVNIILPLGNGQALKFRLKGEVVNKLINEIQVDLRIWLEGEEKPEVFEGSFFGLKPVLESGKKPAGKKEEPAKGDNAKVGRYAITKGPQWLSMWITPEGWRQQEVWYDLELPASLTYEEKEKLLRPLPEEDSAPVTAPKKVTENNQEKEVVMNKRKIGLGGLASHPLLHYGGGIFLVVLLVGLLVGGIFYFMSNGNGSSGDANSLNLKIFDIDSESPVPNAKVKISLQGEGMKEGVSNEKGEVVFADMPSGSSLHVFFEADGYKEQSLTLACCEDASVKLTPFRMRKTILRLHGSNTIGAKLAPELAKGFLKDKLGADQVIDNIWESKEEMTIEGIVGDKVMVIEILAHGSSTAFKGLSSGEADIGMASRRIKDKEVKNLQFLGDMTSVNCEHVLGLDGIAVIVNKNNDLKSMEIETVSKIFSGDIKNWSELGMTPAPINVYARDDNSGTYDTFKNLVLKPQGRTLVSSAKRFESNAELSDNVAEDPAGIGFTGLPYVRKSKELAIADEGAAPIFPNFFTVATEDYPLSRRLYLYSPYSPSNEYTRDFVEYAMASYGQAAVEKCEFVNLIIKPLLTKVETYTNVQNKMVFQKYLDSVKDARRLSLNFRFRENSFSLDNRAMRDLDRMVDFIKNRQVDFSKIILVGFADSTGDYSNNYHLALKRAQKVADELRSRGVYVNQVLSNGEEAPVASNMTMHGREKNRRVEIWIN